MQIIKLTIILLILSITSCKTVKYENLEDGLYADIQTGKGNMLLKLEYENTPITVANFVSLAEGTNIYVDDKYKKKPFYDGLKFHRVVADFMIQGGDPRGNGSGNPGYKFEDEFPMDEEGSLMFSHDKSGTLSMANSGPGTNGSQFFITHKDTPWLDGKHTVFGHVVSGIDVVNATEQDDIMKSVVIIRKGRKARKFKAHKVFPKAVKAIKAAEKAKLATRNGEFKSKMITAYPKAAQTETGLMYEIITKADGGKPIEGATVEVHYVGILKDGTQFDSSVDRGKKFKFKVGAGRVIKGWDEGVQLCDIGGKIRLIIPYWLGYGEAGRSTIPPKATMIFEIEVFNSTQDK